MKFPNANPPNTVPLSPNRPIPSSNSSGSVPRSVKETKKKTQGEKCDEDADVNRLVYYPRNSCLGIN